MTGGGRSIVFTAFGVTVEVALQDPAMLPAVLAVLPPCREEGGEREQVVARFTLPAGGGLLRDGEPVALPRGDGVALGALDSSIRAEVALHAPGRVFVHAGVVAREGRALVVPGVSWSGKSTLVAALVAAGADYLSDEFAVLDADGLVHPYPKPLSLRAPGQVAQVDRRVEELGGVAAARAARVAVIALAPYVPGATWRPRRASAGDGALALLAHAIPARSRPAQSLAAVRRAAERATVLEGERGDAAPAARALLGVLDQQADAPD